MATQREVHFNIRKTSEIHYTINQAKRVYVYCWKIKDIKSLKVDLQILLYSDVLYSYILAVTLKKCFFGEIMVLNFLNGFRVM